MREERLVQAALANPRAALIELDRIDCGESFYEFVQRAWHVLEPVHPFIGGRAVKAVCDALQAVTEGVIKQLLINIPPGCTKSMTASVLWPAWEWGPRGLRHHRFINASYEKGLATRDLVRGRDLICSEWFQARWPLKLKEDQDQKTYYENSGTGWRLATSVGGALIGYRGDRVVVDDPHDVRRAESDVQREEALRWWTESVPTRLNDQEKSAKVLMMQRLHANDLSGHTLRTEGDRWAKLVLPMEYESGRHCNIPEIGFSDWRSKDGELLWPERFSQQAVEKLKHTLSSKGGSYAVAGQLQQRPTAREGGLFRRDKTQFVDSLPSDVTRRVRGWDLAASVEKNSAFTTGVKLAITDRGQIFVEDVVRFRGSPHDVERRLKLTAVSDGYATPISLPQDPGQAGKYQKAALAALLAGFNVHFSTETGDKADRAIPFAAQWEAGNVYIVRGPWNDQFLGELHEFPGSEYKDQVDATSRASGYLLIQRSADDISSTPGLLIG